MRCRDKPNWRGRSIPIDSLYRLPVPLEVPLRDLTDAVRRGREHVIWYAAQ